MHSKTGSHLKTIGVWEAAAPVRYLRLEAYSYLSGLAFNLASYLTTPPLVSP